MSRFLLLNFEDFNLNQDVTKSIQPFSPFCICCLDRNGPMFDLKNCIHGDYLDAFDKPALKQFNQLVCVQCHSMLKKIKRFQVLVVESYNILLSGAFTNTTANNKKLSNLVIQKVVDDLHLPPDIEVIQDEEGSNNEDFTNEEQCPNVEQTFTHNIIVVQNDSNMEQFTENVSNVIQSDTNMEHNFTNNIINIVQDNSNVEQNFTNNIVNLVQDNSNVEQNFTHNIADVQNQSNMEPFTNIDEKLIEGQNRLNRNIKTALEILERNNQNFLSLGSQLQFLNGECLSFLEPSLLSKEILTDIPLVPAKSLSTDLENGLLNNSKLEMDGTDKMFYEGLDLSPELISKEINSSEMMADEVSHVQSQKDSVPKIKSSALKPKKKRKVQNPNALIHMIRRIKLSHEELNRERVLQAQSDTYLKHKFRCETCIVGFTYKENLEDHVKRKHGLREQDGVICEICSQVVPRAGLLTEHRYRHYTRYECVQCSKQYHTHDEAIQHCTKHQGNGGTKRTTKPKSTLQLKRATLKMKPS